MAVKAQQRMIRIELTAEQQKHVQGFLDKEVPALEFTPEQLEERIAPGGRGGISGDV